MHLVLYNRLWESRRQQWVFYSNGWYVRLKDANKWKDKKGIVENAEPRSPQNHRFLLQTWKVWTCGPRKQLNLRNLIMDQKQWTFITATKPSQFRARKARRAVKTAAGLHNWRIHGIDLSTESATTANEREKGNAQENILPSSRRSPALTSASLVPDWAVGAHVWRIEDVMAAFQLPQQSYGYYCGVINHYLAIIVPKWTSFDEPGPNPFVDSQIKISMECPLLLEALASFSTAHEDSLYQIWPSERARRHKQVAISLINSKLVYGVVEDSTILAVAQLGITVATLASEMRTPEHLKELEVHMNGIEAMVNHRGGIYNLGMRGVLNKIICWQDQLTAELTGKPLRFAPEEGNQPVPGVDVTPFAGDFNSPIPWSVFMLAPQSGESNKSIIGVLSQLVRLTKIETDLDSATVEEKTSYERILKSMEEEMFDYITKARSVAPLNRVNLIREACCISGSIYTQVQFRNAVPGHKTLEVLKARLIYIFMNLNIEDLDRHSLKTEAPFLLWILFNGAILCMNDVDRAFFIRCINSLVVQLQIVTWGEVDNILKGYLWTDKCFTWMDWNLRLEIETPWFWK